MRFRHSCELPVALCSFAGRALYRALASDETKIRWMVERMIEGYDEGDVWTLRAEADLEKGEQGWKIVASRHQDVRGTELGR